MFVSFPTAYSGRIDSTEMAIEIDDIRQIAFVNSKVTVLLLNDREGGFETFRVRMGYRECIQKVNHAKLHAASFVDDDVVAAQGGTQ
jgi:hypothetical protein